MFYIDFAYNDFHCSKYDPSQKGYLKGKNWTMSTIKMAHIDDHFIHGQVATRWCETLDANLIIVVNDELASNKMRQGLLDMAVPDKINSRYYTIEKAIHQLPMISNEKRIMLIVDSIKDIYQLINAGIDTPLVNLGSLGVEPGKRHITNTLAMDDEDFHMLEQLISKGIQIDSKVNPEDDSQALISQIDLLN